MAATKIHDPKGLADVLKGELGSHNDPDNHIDAENDVQRLFEFPVSAYLPLEGTAADDYTHAVFDARKACRVVGCRFIPHAALTADDDHYTTILLKNGATTVATMAATTTGGTGDWVANTPEDMTLATAKADLELAAGATLTLTSTKTGANGVARPAGILQLDVQHN